jgi:GAF domain-containing protein
MVPATSLDERIGLRVIGDFGIRGAARLWYAKTLAAAGSVPYARDAPTARAGEGPADHVLLLGNGPAHGWGVASHQLGLCGQLAHAVSKATGRAAEVDFVGAELMNAESAVTWLGARDLTGYDAVVVVMGLNDAVRLTPVKAWERDVAALLAHLRAGLRHDAPVVVCGVQAVTSFLQITPLIARLGQRRADAMNAATARIAASTPSTTFLPLDPPELEAGRSWGSAMSYRGRADGIAAGVAPLLDAHRGRGAERRRAKVDVEQWTWSGAPDLLAAAAERGTPELRRLVNAAKLEFEATLAVVTYLEGDRMWFAAASADTPVSIPSTLSYDAHVPDDGVLVVPDAAGDPRFRTNPFILQSHLPFYAGHPLRDLSGRMIGTFCLLAARPRPASSIRPEMLQTYAAQAEAELHRIERAALGRVTA